MIGAAAYKMLAKRSDVKIFTVTVSEIDRLIITAEVKPEGINLHELSYVEALKQVKAKLSSEYHDYLNVFNKAMTD